MLDLIKILLAFVCAFSFWWFFFNDPLQCIWKILNVVSIITILKCIFEFLKALSTPLVPPRSCGFDYDHEKYN